MKKIPRPSPKARLALANAMVGSMGYGPGYLNLPKYQGGGSDSGQICLMNEALFTQEHFSEPLTTFATGWRDPSNIVELMNFIAPPVQVGRRFEFKQAINAEEFIVDSDDIRAIGASFKEVTYTGTTVYSKTLNKGLSIRLDNDQYTDLAQAQNMLTAKLLRRLYRSEYARCLAILAAAATNNAKTWSSGTPNPINDLRSIILAGELLSGISNNRLLWAKDAWSTQQAAFETANNPLGYSYAKMTPQQIAEALLCDKGMVTNAVYQSSATGKSRLAAGLIFSFFAEDGVDKEDPTHIKRFWSPTDSGGPIRVYSQVYAKYVEVTVEHYSLPVALTTLGVEAITVS